MDNSFNVSYHSLKNTSSNVNGIGLYSKHTQVKNPTRQMLSQLVLQKFLQINHFYMCFSSNSSALTMCQLKLVSDSSWLKSSFSSVQFSCSVMTDSLRPHESQHTRPPCPSPTPGVYPNSCPSSRWCHPAISSFVVPFSSWLQSLPASGSFPMSQLFTWGGQSTGVSASASVLPMNTQDWSPLG